MVKIHHKVLLLFLLAIFYPLFGGQASAQQSNQATIDAGVAYLQATQNPDGGWGGTETSLNTIFQATATTARTLQFLGIPDTTLSNALIFLSAQSPDTVDDLSHQIEVLASSGGDVSSWAASIKLARQEDGGWGINL